MEDEEDLTQSVSLPSISKKKRDKSESEYFAMWVCFGVFIVEKN